MSQISIQSGVAYGTVYNYLAKNKAQTAIFRPITMRTSIMADFDFLKVPYIA